MGLKLSPPTKATLYVGGRVIALENVKISTAFKKPFSLESKLATIRTLLNKQPRKQWI